MADTPERGRRRRRTPAEAEAEIIAAAEALLRERPFRELTVDEVMRRTELSRPSFYVYFRDRHNLLLKVVERISQDMFEVADRWYQGGQDGPTDIRTSMEGVVVAFREHGRVLRALSDAAANDPRVEEVYGGLVSAFTKSTAQHIRGEVEAGNALPLDPDETAKAVVWMCERYLLQELGGVTPPSVDEKVIANTLVTIMSRTIYGRDA